MISLESKGKTIYTIAEGKLDEEDYKELIPFLERKVDFNNNINWYFEMKNFKGWSPKAIWEDLRLDVECDGQLNKIAMVGNKKWENWVSKLMKPFSYAKIKYFDIEEKRKAQQWIES